MLKPWWTRDRLRGVIEDVIAAELARLRPGQPPLENGQLGPQVSIGRAAKTGENRLGVDSLELMNLTTAVSEMFHVHETGLDDLFLARRRLDDWVDTVIRSRRAADDRITFATSGSTGTAKPCAHGMPALEQEAAFLAGLFSDRRRILAAQPRHHIYGFLFTCMLPALLGCEVIDARGSLPASLLRQARPGDLVVAHPAILKIAVRLRMTVAEDVVVVTSTAPADAELWEALRDIGVARIIEVYGASETSGIGHRADHRMPFTLMPHWRPAHSADHDLIRSLPNGEPLPAWLQDVVDWTGPCEFHVVRRKDKAVQVGGINVFPDRVRDRLVTHPKVADAAVRLMAPQEGERLKAFIVPARIDGGDAAVLSESGKDALARELMLWLSERLRPEETPRSITVGETLPYGPSGKMSDWAVSRPDGSDCRL